MVENDNCLIWIQGPWIPCRGFDKGKPSMFFSDSQGRCPFSQCMAALVLSNPNLLARIINPNDEADVNIVRMLLFNAICPGHINTKAEENAIYKYSAEMPFFPFYSKNY